MRYILLLCICCGFLSSGAQLVPVGTTWNYYHWTPTRWPESRGITITAVKDTLIAGKIYTHLDGEQDGFKTIENGKVYYYLKNDHHLFFDFNAQKNDTLIVDRCLENDTIFPFGVIIDTIYYEKDIQRDSLRVYVIRPVKPDMPGEGMSTLVFERLLTGDPHSIYGNTVCSNDLMGFILEASNISLQCYREPGGFSFLQVDSGECYRVGIDEVIGLESQVSLYPNPSNGIFTIGNDSKYTIQHIDFYDLSGKQITQAKTTGLNEVDSHLLPSGQYWVIIEFTNGYRTIKKLVIVH
jgi:hypothetical protein